ncbi:MAG: hypothetical protein ACRDYX_11035 [Egibacteraceae bacterium]
MPAAQKQEEMIAALWDRLRSQDRWLLIFDNAEEPAMLEEYRPPAGGGHVLITSRNPAWGGVATPVAVETLDRAEAVAFLTRRTGSAAEQLAEQLGDLPLALEQATSYVEQTGMSLARYLELFTSRRDEAARPRPARALSGDRGHDLAAGLRADRQGVAGRDPTTAPVRLPRS